MKLLNIQVRNYKCIADTERFSVSAVTALVGKNESGKTAILTAIEKLNSVSANRGSFTPRDYPRRLWRPNQPIPNDPPVIESEWQFDDDDIATLSKQFGVNPLSTGKAIVSKGYDNVLRANVTIDEGAVIENLLSDSDISSAERAALGESTASLDALQNALKKMDAPSGGYVALNSLASTRYPGGVKTVEEAVKTLVPKIIYFSDYNKLAGQVSLTAFLARKSENKLAWPDLLFEALLNLAGTTPQGVQQLNQFEELNASLRAVSNQISEEIFAYWTQNKHLDVLLRFDHALPGDPVPFNEGYVFRTRIDNRRHKADTSFDDRSTGFVWFFSFLVWFSQLKARHGSGLLILLDEPGLTLHARAQADLLRYINERLKPDHQVIYSTHSPFMIDPDNLLSARTVEDVVEPDGTILGTKVGDKVLSMDPDTISPLQRALDYEITQSLFVGKHTLLVEGPADLAYLKWFSKQCEVRGLPALDYRWTICICHGVDKIPAFASLFAGNGLHIAALVDMAIGTKQRLQNARKALGDEHVISVDNYCNKAEADIEDLFHARFYCTLVNSAYGLTGSHLWRLDSFDAATRIVRHAEAHFKILPPTVAEFDHCKPAEWLFEHTDVATKFDGFSESCETISKVFKDLNKLIN